jgi:flagellar basal body P-ring formation protein FlgA
MNIFAILGMCAAILVGGGDGDKEKLEIKLKSTTYVRGLDVTIGELCDITPEGADALAIAKISFGPAPVSGHARTISRTEIVQSIAASGKDLSGLKFAGSNEIVVQPILNDLSSPEMIEAATAALQAVLAIEGGDVEFTAPQRMRLMQAPPGRRSQEFVARLRGDKTGPNSAVIDVEIVVDGVSYKKVPITFELTRYQQLVKTVGAIRAGTPLGPENCVVSREAMAQVNGMFLTSLDQVVGLNAARDLQSDRRVMLGDTALPSVIRKGDVVTVVLTRGRVKVTARAMANHDAPLAGRITLTNLQSRSQMVGIVSAPGLVVVQQ